MKKFIAVITCLTPEYHKLLSPELISLGYTVAAASSKAISVISYRLSHSNITSSETIVSNIRDSFDKLKGYLYSVVVFEFIGSSWNIGNIKCETDPTRVLQMKALW